MKNIYLSINLTNYFISKAEIVWALSAVIRAIKAISFKVSNFERGNSVTRLRNIIDEYQVNEILGFTRFKLK